MLSLEQLNKIEAEAHQDIQKFWDEVIKLSGKTSKYQPIKALQIVDLVAMAKELLALKSKADIAAEKCGVVKND